MTDPYAHHPELRGRIQDPETSFFRTFTVERLIAERPEAEASLPERYSDAEREALRAQALADHEGDLWVFAYGSLMWDPALRFTDLRRARLDGHARRFILRVEGGRGSREAPGLMAALDAGEGCEGLVFRVPAEEVDHETEILFRRELLGPAYLARLVPVRVDGEETQALTFLANRDAPNIVPDIPHEEQVRAIATAEGFLGSNRDYLVNIVEHFALLGIEDAHCARLMRDVDAFLATRAPEARP